MPAVAVDGVGAVVVPPANAALLYHNKVLLPVAVAASVAAGVFWQ